MSKQGIIIVDHGSRRPQSNEMLEHVARLFADRYPEQYPVVEAAHMELAMPDIAAAYGKCVGRGAEHVVVLPFFLGEGKHWTLDIPSLTNQAARDFPGTRYTVARPLGIDDLILELLKKRADGQDEEVTVDAGADDPRLADTPETRRRVQCATCPFVVTEHATVEVKPSAGITLEQLAERAREG